MSTGFARLNEHMGSTDPIFSTPSSGGSFWQRLPAIHFSKKVIIVSLCLLVTLLILVIGISLTVSRSSSQRPGALVSNGTTSGTTSRPMVSSSTLAGPTSTSSITTSTGFSVNSTLSTTNEPPTTPMVPEEPRLNTTTNGTSSNTTSAISTSTSTVPPLTTAAPSVIHNHTSGFIAKVYVEQLSRNELYHVDLNGQNTESLGPIYDTIEDMVYHEADECIYMFKSFSKNGTTITRRCFEDDWSETLIFQDALSPSMAGCMALDWIGNNIFWTNFNAKTGGSDLEVLSLDGKSKAKLHLDQSPSYILFIALAPPEGLLFAYSYTGELTRMMMDGSKGLILTARNVFPNAVALDVKRHQVLSLEYKDEYLVASDYSGKTIRTVRVMGENSHEIELGDDRMYWLGDPTRRKIYSTRLNGTDDVDVFDIGQGLTILNFVPLTRHVQEPVPDHPCSVDATCGSDICVPMGKQLDSWSHTCLSNTKLVHEDPDERGDSKSCHPMEFLCNSTNSCILDNQVCDTNLDCPDRSDETQELCDSRKPFQECRDSQQFVCKTTNLCIPLPWVCDKYRDCLDGSDEDGCF
ncbi:hypothetical protein TCAL_11895 [Tigriopus californicus]|uniref:Uncharacterized protein n=1 Tax=Tigriopus californicus TaxID=6832 RepID=A0A553PJY0_TIGCA|nr:low-density lipoprotein receptor-related protein 1B-like [Tigriopus californicus]TRY77987.1 hypothetical protein TCAL_11895 [Tigriopus californicus]|eukprot:TCALIF_11895-PA protein Name:"Similar to VgR Vitellogenin receptor (Solenopsis invicta)" AED:0.00 eAED:0.00 QI:332/1/1/1/1/1/4/161/577